MVLHLLCGLHCAVALGTTFRMDQISQIMFRRTRIRKYF